MVIGRSSGRRREDDEPDDVDEVPVEADGAERARRAAAGSRPRTPSRQDDRQRDEPERDVQPVETRSA